MQEQVSLIDFWDMLDHFDWDYIYVKDNQYWRENWEKEKRFHRIARQSPEHDKMRRGFISAAFSGPRWKTPQILKPLKPAQQEENNEAL